MKSGKSGALRVVAIGFGATTVTLVLLTPWLSWWNIVALHALLNLIFINSLVIFLIVSHIRPLVDNGEALLMLSSGQASSTLPLA
jgi:hypothetical protein